MATVLFYGKRLFMKFPDLAPFANRFATAGHSVVSTETLPLDRVYALARDVEAIVALGEPVDARLIAAAGRLRAIQTLSVGYDIVDVAAATDRGIPVSNCPEYCTEEVAEHALALALHLLRRNHESVPYAQTAGWGFAPFRPVRPLSEQRFGVLGLGRIGRQFAMRIVALGAPVAAYDPYVADATYNALQVARVASFEQLAADSDVLSIHAPLTDRTHHIVNATILDRMKPTAVLINTARGPLVDQQALTRALDHGKIAAAGLDVLEVEPPPRDEPLLHHRRAVVTPHIAWYSERSYARNRDDAVDEVVRVLDGTPPRYVVNPAVLAKRS